MGVGDLRGYADRRRRRYWTRRWRRGFIVAFYLGIAAASLVVLVPSRPGRGGDVGAGLAFWGLILALTVGLGGIAGSTGRLLGARDEQLDARRQLVRWRAYRRSYQVAVPLLGLVIVLLLFSESDDDLAFLSDTRLGTLAYLAILVATTLPYVFVGWTWPDPPPASDEAGD